MLEFIFMVHLNNSESKDNAHLYFYGYDCYIIKPTVRYKGYANTRSLIH